MPFTDRKLNLTDTLANGSVTAETPALEAQRTPILTESGARQTLDELRQWIEAETGMDFSGNHLARLREAVSKVLGGGRNASLHWPLVGDRGRLLEQLTAELTVGESFFFRNEFHFRALREQVFPQLLRENADKREIRIWSAGCATGEEPYSLAILLDQVRASSPLPRANWIVSILATDLNPEFLDRALNAAYRPWSFRQTNIQQNRRYFSPQGEFHQLAAEMRKQVHFAYLNLVKDVYPSALTGTLGLDLILFRNVAIYLRPAVTAEIVERFYRALRPGGWLLLGETEIGLAPASRFEVHRFDQATFLRKPAGASREPLDDPGGFAVPVLAKLSLVGFKLPASVPKVPDWVPLPAFRSSRMTGSKPVPTSHGSAWTAPRSATAAEATWARVESLIAERRLSAAEEVMNRIGKREERGWARLRSVRLLLAQGESSCARRMLDACLKEQPLLIEAQLLQASCAEDQGELEAAEQAYRRALYIDRRCPMAHFHLALVQRRRGQHAAALRSLRTTLKLIESQNPHSLVEYGEGICCGRLKEMAAAVVRLWGSGQGASHARA